MRKILIALFCAFVLAAGSGCASYHTLKFSTRQHLIVELEGSVTRVRVHGNVIQGYSAEVRVEDELDSLPANLLHDPSSLPELPLLGGEQVEVLIVLGGVSPSGKRLPALLAVVCGSGDEVRVLGFDRRRRRWRVVESKVSLRETYAYRWLGYLALPFAGALDLVTLPLQGILGGLVALTR
jgi:uncharacterized protein YceK